MPVTPTYPGIYILELPGSAHTIAAAPTSVTVFVGYSHPFKTRNLQFGTPVEIFSFSDYEREFVGFIQSAIIDRNLPLAVSQFFLNGGSDAVVVGLDPSKYYDATTTPKGSVKAGTGTLNTSIVFTALEPTDSLAITVDIGNIPPTANNVADIRPTNRIAAKLGHKNKLGAAGN